LDIKNIMNGRMKDRERVNTFLSFSRWNYLHLFPRQWSRIVLYLIYTNIHIKKTFCCNKILLTINTLCVQNGSTNTHKTQATDYNCSTKYISRF